MQFEAISGQNAYHGQLHGVFDRPPAIGDLPPALVAPLVGVLARNTSASASCWFALWNGFAATPAWMREAASFELPTRTYFLFAGDIGDAQVSYAERPFHQSANLWWPNDHAWLVVTDIDLNSTYIGCSQDASAQIRSCENVEAYEVELTTRITADSDEVNAS